MTQQRTLSDDVAKFLGLEPYGKLTNPRFHDPYFALACRNHLGPAAWSDALSKRMEKQA